jgi:protein-S-isoprenylcysteine O-methyltransferase Ste14
MKENELPYYGVGPYYCGSIIILTIVTILLSYLNIIPKYSVPGLELIFNMLGIALIIGSIALWIWGALKSDIHDNIDNDQLITSGAYAYVRNPIYSAFLFLATGMIVFSFSIFTLSILFPTIVFNTKSAACCFVIWAKVFADKQMTSKKIKNRFIVYYFLN